MNKFNVSSQIPNLEAAGSNPAGSPPPVYYVA